MAVTDIAMAGVAALVSGMAALVLILRALDRGAVAGTRRPGHPGPLGPEKKEGYAGTAGYGRPPGYGPPPLWDDGPVTDQTAAQAPGTGRQGTA